MATVIEASNTSDNHYESMPLNWKNSCVATEGSLHQLSPYIGKLKSSIARELILKYSKPGDLIVDPYSGSGTIPLEAIFLNRNVFACDVNPYASILNRAKLFAPSSLEAAKHQAEELFIALEKLSDPDLRKVPSWVRAFFHPKTLKETLKAVDICIKLKNDFLLACILGILHHQRPGFLSFPSSHLVPYLRDKKYPKDQFPQLYEYRPLRQRLLSKIERAYKRPGLLKKELRALYIQGKIEDTELPDRIDCVITSPPYMNALDYNRDNRLRLWFITRSYNHNSDRQLTGSKVAFEQSITNVARKVEKSLVMGGYCVMIIGERLNRSSGNHPSEFVRNIILEKAPSLKLIKTMSDGIPDIRRSRRNYRGIKTEHFLIYQRC